MAREIRVDSGLWQNLPESSGLWYDYNVSREEVSRREDVVQQVMLLIGEVIRLDLTDRQREVVTLYYSPHGLTQTSIAVLLGISQSTVSQHLNGKKRHGRKVGGAMRRIRKAIHRRAHAGELPKNGNRILRVLDALLNGRTGRRWAAKLLASLRC